MILEKEAVGGDLLELSRQLNKARARNQTKEHLECRVQTHVHDVHGCGIGAARGDGSQDSSYLPRQKTRQKTHRPSPLLGSGLTFQGSHWPRAWRGGEVAPVATTLETWLPN